jgi:catalase
MYQDNGLSIRSMLNRGIRRLHWQAAIFATFVIGNAPSVFAEEIKPLFQSQLPDVAGKTFTAVEVDFAPGSKADAHRHGRAFLYAYVLSGTVRSQIAGEPVHTFRAGQGWTELPGARHLLTENISRKAAARLLVVFVSDVGAPLKTPDQESEKDLTMKQNSSVALPPVPQQMVDALHTAFGDHHSRAVHAKGIMAVGHFEPSKEAAGLSKAALFDQGKLPVLVRFSDFTGIPEIPDNVGDANPRGFAVKFKLPDGSTADIVSHSFNGFPTATSAEFRELLLAIGASGAGVAKPTALDAFLGSHPIAKTFLTTQKPPPESYTSLSYFGVNAFEFTGANGNRHFVRYRFVPVGGESVLKPEELASKGPNYLQTELPARLMRAPVAFDWYAQIADASDVIDDPSIAWPESRKLVKLGTLTIDHIAPDPAATDKATMFSPLNVPDGIGSADPMLGVRQGAYPISFQHRQ